MLVLWNVRVLDRDTRRRSHLELYLQTEALDPKTRAMVEFLVDSKSQQSQRRMMAFRHLFKAGDHLALVNAIQGTEAPRIVCDQDYLEDQIGNEIRLSELGMILTGDPNIRLVPPGMKQHDIDYMNSEPRQVPLENVVLSADDLHSLGYFVRDLQELDKSAFRKEGPGRLGAHAGFPSAHNPSLYLETATSDDEIRSFITIFRRLYMPSDPGNFAQAVKLYSTALDGHPLANWVKGVEREYDELLVSPPEMSLLLRDKNVTFSTKRLIDVFLYTRFAHQPDARRQEQYNECLQQIGGQKAMLTWLFLSEIWGCSLKMISAGRLIANWFRDYCELHKLSPQVIPSLHDEHLGIGSLEKKTTFEKKLFEAKISQLAGELWEQDGCPESGIDAFVVAAHELLKNISPN